jgi:organic radical activating enzyme
MDGMKRYIECYIATETCNLRCHYCYITQKRKFNAKLVEFTYSPEYMRNALSVERLGGKCLFNLCAGGETLLNESLISVIRELLDEGHYVMVVTNGLLSSRFDRIVELPAHLVKHIIFKFSFHYLELKRINKFDVFFENIHKIRNAGCSFTVELTPNDETIEYIDDIKTICMKELGALCHVTIARDDNDKRIPVLSKYTFSEYKKIWGTFNSDLFDFKTKIFYRKRKEFCYAGDWSCYLNLATGDLHQCYAEKSLQNIYADIKEPIKFLPVGHGCRIAHCYNGHAFLSLGVIPELDTPSYGKLRNRYPIGKAEWLNDDMKIFLSSKLKDANRELTGMEKLFVKWKNRILALYNFNNRIKRKLGNTSVFFR